jgi:hypothetical protein
LSDLNYIYSGTIHTKIDFYFTPLLMFPQVP